MSFLFLCAPYRLTPIRALYALSADADTGFVRPIGLRRYGLCTPYRLTPIRALTASTRQSILRAPSQKQKISRIAVARPSPVLAPRRNCLSMPHPFGAFAADSEDFRKRSRACDDKKRAISKPTHSKKVRLLNSSATKTGTPINAMTTPTGIHATPSSMRETTSATSSAIAPAGIDKTYVVRISHR